VSVFQKSNSRASARRQIDIKGVQDGILLLPNGEYRAAIEASSVNFELKSEDEQDALIETYESFLNSLPCPLQIIIRVRELDMDKYLDDLDVQLNYETEKIYQDQLENYADFVRSLVTDNKILSRRFYVVLPFETKDSDGFEAAKEQLAIRMDIVRKGLMRLGMQTKVLGSLDILDLFHDFYNPAQAKEQPISGRVARLLTSAYVQGER
jgi:hypothetical protein